MKNLIFAIIAIASVTLFTSCDGSNDPGYEGPCNTCGTNGGQGNNGGGGNGGGGTGNGGSGNGGGATDDIECYVYDLVTTSTVKVYPIDGSPAFNVGISTNLSNQMRTYSNTHPVPCQRRYVVNVAWIQNGLTFEWFQRAETGSPAPDC